MLYVPLSYIPVIIKNNSVIIIATSAISKAVIAFLYVFSKNEGYK